METNVSVLIVEDDRPVRSLISLALESAGYHYRTAQSGKEALLELTSHTPDILILDLGLPDLDGTEIIQKVRQWSSLPIIVVSARSDDNEKIQALDLGADDYLTKPFNVDELLARIRVANRRIKYMKEGKQDPLFTNGGLKIDFNANTVYINNAEVHLTPIEYKLLSVMAKNVGRVLTHNFILKEVWNNALPSDEQSMRVYMASLRNKIETPLGVKLIQTHIGIGYRMVKL